MLEKADIAMYRGEARGRGCHELFDAEMQQWVACPSARGRVAVPLRTTSSAVEFQPAVDTSDGRVVGFEALVRWERPGFGLVPPGDFIPYAEERRPHRRHRRLGAQRGMPAGGTVEPAVAEPSTRDRGERVEPPDRQGASPLGRPGARDEAA